MDTASVAVLHCRHMRSPDPLQACCPSLLVRWVLVVTYVCRFTGFCWIIGTSRETTVRHFLETLTCGESVTFFRYYNENYANRRQRTCFEDPTKKSSFNICASYHTADWRNAALIFPRWRNFIRLFLFIFQVKYLSSNQRSAEPVIKYCRRK